MLSSIRIILLFLVATYIVVAKQTFTAQMIDPNGTVVQLDPERDFTPFTRQDTRSHQWDSDDADNDHIFSWNWCGVVSSKNSPGRGSDNLSWISQVQGHFTVPILELNYSKTDPAYVAAWIALDGYSCRSAFLQVGIWSSLDFEGKQTNKAFWAWWPSHAFMVDNLDATYGDEINITIIPRSHLSTDRWGDGANITIQNLSNGQFHLLEDPGPGNPIQVLCGTDAEWIVEDPRTNQTDPSTQQGGFADFAPVKFSHATGVVQYPDFPAIQDIYLTNMTTNIYLKGSDGKVKCAPEYSDDTMDNDQAMWVNGTDRD